VLIQQHMGGGNTATRRIGTTDTMILLTVVMGLVILSSASTDSNSTDNGDQGFCTTEKESCDGDTEEEKQKYAKIKWTDDNDYLIKDLLDKADDEIVPNPTHAVEMFNNILSDHPQSGRANYALARTLQIKLWKTNNTQEKTELCEKTRMLLRNLMKFNVTDYVKTASAHLLLNVAERDCFNSKTEVIEALQFITQFEADGRYAVVLCHDLFLEERYKEAMEQIDDILARKPRNFFLNLLKSTIMKVREDEKKDVKQANRMLRSLDFDEALEDLKEDERDQEKAVLTMDINYLALELCRKKRQDIRDIILKDASRLHLIPSPLQRPIELMKNLKAQPVWEMNELQSQNRWTNAQSLTGIGQSSDKLNNIEKNFKTIKEEAFTMVNDINEEDSWIEDKSLVSTGSAHIRGLYLYSKKKHETCSKNPRLCKILKKFKDSSDCKKCTSKFVLLHANSRVLPHVGPTNGKLRAILPISVPTGNTGLQVADKVVKLVEGHMVVIDDSFENSLWNETEEDLILLSVDFHHPDLKDRDKKSGSFTEFMKNKFVHY